MIIIDESNKKNKKYCAARVFMLLFGACAVLAAVLLFINNVDYLRGNQSYKDLRMQTQAVITAADEAINTSQTVTHIQDSEAPAQGNIKPIEYQSPIDFAELTAINPDIRAWLLSAGTVIDYPVAQAMDNEFYLSHLYNRELNKLGCLFIDYQNKGDFSDKNTVIYGHHMRSGAMFAGLKSYKDQSYYELFPTMTIYTPERQASIEFFAGVIADGDEQFVRFQFDDEKDFLDYVNELKADSVFQSTVEVQPDDLLVTLCTCSYEFENARFALVGRLKWIDDMGR